MCNQAVLNLPGQHLNTQCSLLLSGQAAANSDMMRRLGEIDARVAEINIKQNHASQTTKNAQKLGQVRFAGFFLWTW